MQQIKWVRADGETEVEVDAWTAAHKRFLYGREVLDACLSPLMDYSFGTDLAIVFPLYLGGNRTYAEMLCKSAMWQLESFLLHTDVRDRGVPIFLAVSDEVYPIAKPYFQRAGLPESRLSVPFVRFSQGEKFGNTLKLETLFQPRFDDFQKVVYFDVDNEIICHPGCAKLPISQYLIDHYDAEARPFLLAKSLKTTTHSDSAIVRLPADHSAWHRIASIFDMSIADLQAYWYHAASVYDVRGWYVGIAKHLRTSRTFRTWIRQWYDILPGSDEMLLELYFYFHRFEDSQVCNFQEWLPLRAFQQRDADFGNQAFLCHLSE